MQQSLITAGIRVPGGADGVFGSSTAGAIMEYQRREGLPVTGKIDDQTAGKLGQAAAPAPVAPSANGITLTAFPVQGQCWFGDTWQAPRGGGRLHEGLDVIAPEGKQIYAVVDGIISKQYFDYPGALSGNGFRISQPNGTYFTYLHMSAFADGLGVGSPVDRRPGHRLRRQDRQRGHRPPPFRGTPQRRCCGQPVPVGQGRRRVQQHRRTLSTPGYDSLHN